MLEGQKRERERRLSDLTATSSAGKRHREAVVTNELFLRTIMEKNAQAEQEISALALSGFLTARAPVVLNFSISRSPGELRSPLSAVEQYN